MKRMLSRNPKKRPSIENIELHLTGWGQNRRGRVRLDSGTSFFDALHSILNHALFSYQIETTAIVPSSSSKHTKIVAKQNLQKKRKDYRRLY